MYKIELNIVKDIYKNVSKQKVPFEVAPLDVNLAKMQFNMTKRLEREVPEYGDFAPVTEIYNSKDWNLDVSQIKMICEHLKNNDNKITRRLSLYISDKTALKEYLCPIIEGTKADIIKGVNDTKFFEVCKSIVNQADHMIKSQK